MPIETWKYGVREAADTYFKKKSAALWLQGG
jgi:hypothetical protein